MKQILCWRTDVGVESFRFSSKTVAEDALSAPELSNARIVRETITIWDTVIEWKPACFDKQAKESGLAKLSMREKAALGLKAVEAEAKGDK